MVLINVVGVALIALIVWWFWLYKPKQIKAGGDETITIVVDNGVYQPAQIQLPAGKAITLRFLRKDQSPCAEVVQFPALELAKSLAVDKSTVVEIPALETGEYDFHCQMQMYRGKLVVG
ncbi:Cupredoxin-like domain-containing protein [Ferrimonas sediminum]|uniref:Cupredoxin-like domain-containing protein n=1 Tax=Ferrimonas sediminum TaxID=718193 RepID=A0A1G8RLF8_9GAMM|nr:cupredoxin domain-containing protein [Ferrimonas sediminum]SDJ17776.1 Cupredoxin-like domain-containing protein [Ferrimonas sediminum]